MTQDLIVVVPGITGSSLRDPDGGMLWDLSVPAIRHAVRHPIWLRRLQLPDDVGDGPPPERYALTPVALIEGWHLWPGLTTGAGYGALLRALRRRTPRTGNDPGIREFPYDWRLSVTWTAQLLAERCRKWLEAWRRSTRRPDARITFVCHSMGGMVVRYCLEVLPGNRELAGSVITLATPYSGSVKAVRALTGEAFARLGPFQETVTEVARSFPALMQLLPSYRCVEPAPSSRRSPRVPPALEPSSRLRDADVPDLPRRAVERADAVQAAIAAAVARNGPAPYRLHVFGGKKQPTLQSLSVVDAGVRFHSHQRGVDHSGDGTVPVFSAVPPEMVDDGREVLYPRRHAEMCSSELVLDAVRDRLRPVPLGCALATGPALGLDLPEITPAGPTPLVVTSSEPDLALVARAWAEPLAGRPAFPCSETALLPDGWGTFRGEILLPQGIWRVEVGGRSGQVPPISELVVAVPADG